MTDNAQAFLAARIRQIERDCVMGGANEVDADALAELLRQAAEVDWDAGYDQCSDDLGLGTSHATANPWRLP